MKIVIISQWCYPETTPRANRTTELAKEFAKRGYEVVLYAMLGDYDYTRYSKETGIRFKLLTKSVIGFPTNTKPASRFFWGLNFLGKPFAFPWIAIIPSIRRAIKKEGNIDLLITIAAPHVMHWGAAYANLSNVKCWIADCGDPFMGNPYIKQPSYLGLLEHRWCKQCNYITIPVEEGKGGYYKEYHDKIRIIPQGFDYNAVKLADYKKNEIPTFAYAGVFYKGVRDPSLFFDYLLTLNKPFKFICYGGVNNFLSDYVEKLGDRLEIREKIPRDNLLYELSKVDFLVNVSNDSGVQQPSKLIDYALTKRPILNITSRFLDSERESLESFLLGNYDSQLLINDLERYNIVNVANRFITLYLDVRKQ